MESQPQNTELDNYHLKLLISCKNTASFKI